MANSKGNAGAHTFPCAERRPPALTRTAAPGASSVQNHGRTRSMRAIILMFDSLNRHMLRSYADTFVDAPNFARLAATAVTFDNFYAGSMPCMPARREMHTGRYN